MIFNQFYNSKLNNFRALLLHLYLCLAISLLIGCADQAGDNQIDITRNLKQSEAYLLQGQFRAANIEARNAIQKDASNIKGHIALANILNQLGRFKKSIEHLETLPDSAYENSEYLFTLINAYMGRGKYLSAETILQENELLLGQQKNRYLLSKANLLAAQGQLKKAEDTYRQLIDSNPNNINALLGLIRLKQKQADIYIVERLIERADKISPLNPDIGYIKAQININRKQYEQAEKSLTEAISNLPNADVMTPRKSAFLHLLSETLTAQGKTTEAIIYTQKIAEAFPGAEIAQGDFRDASLLFEKGEFEDAEKILDALVKEYPGFEDASILLGIIKYRDGDIEAAASYLNQNVDAEITHPEITKLAAMTSLLNNQPERVMSMLGRYRHSHEDPQILILYGQAALLEKQKAKAESALKRAIDINPSIAESYLSLADLYNSERPANKEKALAILREGYAINTENFGLASGLARQLFFSQRISEANMFIDQLLKQHRKTNNDQSSVLELAGDFYHSQKKYIQANEFYRQALSIDPNDFESAMKLAINTGDTRNYDEQLEILRQAAFIKKDSSLPLKQMLANAKTITEVKKAEKIILELAVKLNPAISYSTLAQFYANRGQLDKARTYLAHLTKHTEDASYNHPAQLAIYYEDAKQNISKGDIDSARKSAMAGLMLAPRSSLLLILLTEMEIQNKNYIEAQKLVNRINLNNEALGNELQGDIYRAQNNFMAAIESYQALWRRQPSNVLGNKIYSLLKATENNQHKDFLLEWRDRMPDSIDALTAQANDFLLAEDYSKAIVLLERIDHQEPDSAVNLNNMAWTYQQLGDSAALATAKRAYELAPDHASIVDTYGWILFKNGELEKAKALLQKADQLSPNNKTIQSHLSTIEKN